MIRTYANYASEEKVKIYQGTTVQGPLVFTTETVSVAGTFTYNLCLVPGQYLLYMTDAYGDGWSAGSSMTLTNSVEAIGTYRCNSGNVATEVITIAVPVPTEWCYSNEAQTSGSWKTGSTTWPVVETFPAVTTTTRYFRTTLTAGANYAVRLTVTTDVGFRAYLNGAAIMEWGLPSGDITASTYAVNSTATPTQYVVSTTFAIYHSASGEYVIAVEVHASEGKVNGDETFSCDVKPISRNNYRLIDSQGSYYSHPATTGGEGSDMLFDDSVYTKWCFVVDDTDHAIWSVWTFGTNRRELMNKYTLSTANDMSIRDCLSWKISASNDQSTWMLLDEQNDVVWNDRRETREFVISNYEPYAAYKWECTKVLAIGGTDNRFQMSEWNLLLSDQPYVTPSVDYPQSSYIWSVNVDNVNIAPVKSGFSGFMISGAGGATLPNGLVFNSLNGAITGIPTSSMAATQFTISATYVDGQQYTTVLTITVNACDLPNFISVVATKTNPDALAENWYLKNSADETVMSKLTSGRMCIPTGDYTLLLSSSSGTTWSATSILTISAIINDQEFTIATARLTIKIQDTIKLSLVYPLPPASVSTIKYLADGTVPANWNTESFSDSQWTTLNDASRPASVNKIQLYRATFNVASVTGYHGFEIQVKSRAGVVIYLNGEEVYRRFLPAGDISASTTAIGGGVSSSWKAVTGVIGKLHNGQNTIAVGIITLTESALDFDMSLRLMGETVLLTRYWDYTTIGSADNLFDSNPDTRYSAAISASAPAIAGIKFNGERAEAFNEYCIVTDSSMVANDPRDWTVEGSNDDETFTALDTRTGMVFEGRSTEYCFYMASNTKAYTTYRIKITSVFSETATSVYLTQWNLYNEDLASLEVPELSFTPNTLTGYTSVAFPGSVCSSTYYNTFSISPALPSGLTISSMTGVITGVMTREYAATEHTITALNHLGEEKHTTVTIAVQRCAGDMISFTLIFEFGSGATSCSYQLLDRTTSQVVDSRSSFINDYTLSIPMCRPATTYLIRLMKTDTSGWGSNNVKVQLADGSILLTESLASGYYEKDYPFNPAYSVLPQWTTWSYLYGSAPSGWMSDASVSSSWETALPVDLPAATSVTQYYVKVFEIPSLADFASADITVMVKAGAVVYLNGVEIRRINMPEGAIDSNTAATKENVIATAVVVGESVLNELLKDGTNILAVETHRVDKNEETNSFDASALLILDNMYMLKDGEGTTEPSATGDEGSDKLFDNNASTKFSVGGCVGTEFTWRYANDRREPITNYALVNANDCNVRSPSGWSFMGSNDGAEWTTLQRKESQFYSSYFEQKRYDVYNPKAYNMYKVVVNECNNPALSGTDGSACGATSFQLADFYMFTKRMNTGYCKPDGEYAGALEGDSSYKNCPQLYDGIKYRLCANGTFAPEVNACSPKAPAGMSYPQEIYNLVMKKDVGAITPQVVAAAFTASIFPNLPAGLSLNPETAVISGAPTVESEMKKYTVTVKNVAGSIYTTLSISVEKAPINWVLIGILIAVVVIVIVVIIVVIATSNKKKVSSSKKKVPKTTSKAGNKPAPAKPKAAIKV